MTKKSKFLFFRGQRDPDAYLQWETEIEHIFQCNTYSHVQKVQVAALEFKDYELVCGGIKLSRKEGGMEIHPLKLGRK